jgi:Mg-chelatase subunit ChlI
VLNFTGVKVSDLRRVDLRPATLARTYYEAQGKLVKYYENIRFVYEVESRVREIKQAAAPEEKPRPKEPEQPKRRNDNTSGDPDKKQNENYSREESRAVVASLDALRLFNELGFPSRRIS